MGKEGGSTQLVLIWLHLEAEILHKDSSYCFFTSAEKDLLK